MSKPKKIAQYTLEGEFIQTFNDAGEAAVFINKKLSAKGNISAACHFKKTYAYNYRWLFEEDMPRAKELFEQHPIYKGKPHTFEEILEAASDCKTKQEFNKKHSDLYCYAYKKKWMGKINFERALDPYRDKCYTVYAIPFYETNTVYVGLTDNLNRRWAEHTSVERKRYTAPFKYSQKTGIPMPDYPLVLEEELTAFEALYFEDFWKRLYKSLGMRTLNAGRTGIKSGSLGNVKKISNKKILETAKSCKTLNEFRTKYNSLYTLAQRRGLLEKIELERDSEKPGTYTEEYCYNSAKKYKTIKEFRCENVSLERTARLNGWQKQYWWLYCSAEKPILKTTGLKIKIYKSLKSCLSENGSTNWGLYNCIRSNNPYNGSYYHYLDINDIEFDIPDFEHRHII